MAVFARVAVLGLGLLGGSVALAARQRGAAARVAGAARRRDVRDEALRLGAVDEVGDFPEVARGADLVVLATPVFAMAELVRRIAPELHPGALVTDVGSVKGLLAETLPGLLPRGVHYVGSHPMAGSHWRGLAHARGDLFEGSACVVTRGSEPSAAARVEAFWRALGARVVLRDAAAHDAEVAWMSHLPHVAAFAYAGALRAAPPGARDVAGPGFADFTRIAHSDPELWSEILTANRKALVAPLQRLAESLAELGRAIDSNDAEAVEHWLAAARSHLSPASLEETGSTSKPTTGHGRPSKRRPGEE